MKLIFEKLTVGSDEGFTFKEIRGRGFSCPWHFHTENELILTLDCPGFRMVGDNITPLQPGDLVLIGSNLPHIWQPDRPKASAHMLIVQFESDFLGADFWLIPATHPLRQLFQRAVAGLAFAGKTRQRATDLMQRMSVAKGLQRLVLFLDLLQTLAAGTESHTLASPGYNPEGRPFHQARMDRIFQFVAKRLDQPIRLPEVARLAGLSEGAFSRFFREHSGRTFPEFVNQLRVGRACRLLAETEMKITEVALSSGFSNLSNFNRQFLELKKITPREFRRRVASPRTEQV